MPILFEERKAVFDGDCALGEAMALAEWLEAGPATADLSRCTGLHTALLQLLLAGGVGLEGTPADPFLARWVAPLLPRRG